MVPVQFDEEAPLFIVMGAPGEPVRHYDCGV